MPCFTLFTNVGAAKVPANFVVDTCNVVAKALQKPLQYCMVHVVPDQMIAMGGSNEACGSASLMSIGQLGVEQNKKIAATLYAHIEKHLGIPQDRMYITFVDADRANVGYGGTTFHEMFGGK